MTTHPHGGAYLTETDYVGTFHREMTPAWLGTVATALGHAPADASGGLRYCDLGCGPGLGTVLMVAANPAAHFTAIDANPRHVAQARALVSAAEIGNVDVMEADFSALAAATERRRGPFDIIALHGVFSWIPEQQRRDVVALIDRWLAPGGLVYLHYMAHPGLASFAAGQVLLRRFAATRAGDAGTRTRDGLDFLQRLADAGAGFFVAHPEERQRIANARKQDPRYLAHEFLNPTWQPLHVAEVMEAFADIGCTYLGSADPSENIDALSLPGGTAGVLAEIADPALRETVKDFARNQSYRRDIYRRAGTALPPRAHMEALGRVTLARLPHAPRKGGLTFDTRIGPIEGSAELFSPLLAALAAEGRIGFRALARQLPFARAPSLLNQAFQMLAWSACAHPLLSDGADPAPALRLNRQLACHVLETKETQGWLAAPAVGSALPADRAQLAAFLALAGARPNATAEAVRQHLPPEADAAAWLAGFGQEILPVWRALGIVPVASG